jgi:serine/threonine protein kinase
LSYCHRFGICHRDLKPENLLLDKEHNTIKIADFGMAALQPAGSLLSTFCGSPHYASPEILNGQKYKGDKTDIWSLGIILFVLLCGRLPFDEEDVSSLRAKVINGRYIMPTNLSKEAKDLIFRMLQTDPEVRFDMDQIWDHALMHKYEVVGGSANGRNLNMDRWGGAPPPPTPEQVGRPVRRRHEIDGEILRNLRTLWHGEDEEAIVTRLLSKE